MIRQYELIDKILAYNPKADVALLNRAYVFSMKAHGNQKRASGQPYLAHPLEVCSILADLKLDDATIATGLLHDTIEDTLASYDEIKALFGDDIADLTNGVTKLSKISFEDKSIEQAENFRKLLLAMAEDIRVLLVKLADRLHNMRTLHHIPKPDKRQRIAQETMDIFVPLADRIGVYAMKSELEDLAFQQLNELAYEKIEARMEEWRAQDSLVTRTQDELIGELNKAGIGAEIAGREKTIYSIYRKMNRKSLAFDQLTDIYAYRIMVATKRDCYNVLGLMHDVYRAIPGRFKDYISAPKPNGYQSLHTSVIGAYGNRMEIQIRTADMHAIAEAGVAAHWLYKDNKKSNSKTEHDGLQYKWLRQLMDNLQGVEDPQEFYENAKLELFSDNVFVFTPKGDLVALPWGATPLDFAYAIHSDVGHRCQAARLNGSVVPLKTQLSNGDMVEIITSKAQKPNPGWREIAITARAKSAINRYLRQQGRDELLGMGRTMLDKIAARDNYPKVTDKDLSKITVHFKQEDADDVLLAIAQGRLAPKQVLEVLFPSDSPTQQTIEDGKLENLKPAGVPTEVSSIGINGLTDGIAIHMAKCCHPVPGDKIVGIITTGKGVSIHRKNCSNLVDLSKQPDRFLSVSWDESAMPEDMNYTARLRLHLVHKPGTLSTVTTAAFNAEANFTDLQVEHRAGDTYIMRCDLDVHSNAHLEKVISLLSALPVVQGIDRL